MLTSFGANSPIKTKCIDVLYSVENAYLQCCLSNNDRKKADAIDTLKKYNKEFPDSKRIDYLLANALFEVGKKSEGIKQLKKIITGDYYVQPAVNRIIDYYIETKEPDSLKVYSSFYSKAFPNFCNLGKLVLVTSGKSDSTLFQSCKGKFFSQKDSIVFNVLLARKLLNNSPEKALGFYNRFQEENNDFVLDSVKVWERGQYYDIKLRYLFISKQYNKLIDFINKNVGYNKLINIKNDADFAKLIEVYYRDYINQNGTSNEFENFFNKQFAKNKKTPLNL
ncbi:MAG: tetratricopeptide repeat protein [Flavisolibacter sp.]